MPEFSGLKLCGDQGAQELGFGLRKIAINRKDDRLELMKSGTVGWSGNSGFHSLNLAVQFMPSKIVLVGFDMRVDHGIHWHGKHAGLNNPNAARCERWRRNMDAAAETIAALGIRAINASAISALRNYPKMSLLEAIEC